MTTLQLFIQSALEFGRHPCDIAAAMRKAADELSPLEAPEPIPADIKPTDLIAIPQVFINDHRDRTLQTPIVWKSNAKQYWISASDPATPELLSDAEYYADPNGPDTSDVQGLKVSARATAKALRAAGVTPTQ